MEIAIEKFIEFINTLNNCICEDVCQKFISDRSIEFLKLNKSNFYENFEKFYNEADLDMHEIFLNCSIKLLAFLKKGNGIYKEFVFLDSCIKLGDFNAREKLNIINYVIEKNIANGILENGTKEEIIKMGGNYFFTDEKKINNLITNFNLLSDLSDDLECQKVMTDIEDIIDKCHSKGIDLIKGHRVYKENFMTKQEELDKKTADLYIEILNTLEFSKEVIDPIRGYFDKMIAKKNKNKTKIASYEVKKSESKNVMSVKEQNKIYRSIMSMYNIDLQRAIKPLNLEEIIYLVSLMVKINIPDKEIMTAIKNIYKSFSIIYENPFIEFNAYYEKMVYLSDNEDISKAIQDIKDYMSLIFIPDNNKEYSDSKREIKMTIDKVKPILNKNYEYELEKGKKVGRING